MKTIAVFILGASCLLAHAALKSDTQADFLLYESWKSQFGLLYTSPQEDSLRFKIFQQNLEIIDELNQKHPNTEFGLTEFAAMTFEEFKTERVGLKQDISNRKERVRPTEEAVRDAPDAWDWRDHGAVTDVKNQGNSHYSSFLIFLPLERKISLCVVWSFRKLWIVRNY